MRYAIIEDGRVVEIIVADKAFAEETFPGRWLALEDPEWCDVGANYTSAESPRFTPNPVPLAPEPPGPA